MLTALLIPFLLILTIIAAHSWINKKSNYFKSRRIPNMKPNLFLGETVEIFLQRCTPQEFALKLYNSFPEARYLSKSASYAHMHIHFISTITFILISE